MSIMVRLRLSDLREIGGDLACERGRALFSEILGHANDVRHAAGKKPSRYLSIEWTSLHQLWLATAYPQFFGWLRDNRLIPLINLRNADLSCADLSGAILSGAIISVNTEPPKGWEKKPLSAQAFDLKICRLRRKAAALKSLEVPNG